MAKNLIFIKSHIMNHNIIEEYQKYLNIDNYDVIFALDNTEQRFSKKTEVIQELDFYGTKVKCFLFDENVHKLFNLPNYTEDGDESFCKIMWYNADYPFYYVKHYFPDYDFYWQVEFDVFCSGDSYKFFFDEYSSSEDLIACYIEKLENNDWYWSKNADWCYKDVPLYKSFYPIVRLSNRAIDFLRKRKIEIGKIYSQSHVKNKRWLHCELFTPTELINNNFTWRSIDNQKIYFEETFDICDDSFTKKDNILYHPIKYNYLKRIKKLEEENNSLVELLKQKENFQKNRLKTFIKKVFSVQNSEDKLHKIITILGIKISIKNFKK